jgi:hypothetical protein
MAALLDSILNVPELSGLTMDELPLSALIALSFTSKENLIRVQDYMWSKLTIILTPFRLDAKRLMDHMLFTSSLIVGSIALKTVAPATLPIFTNSLDMVVQLTYVQFLEDWLTTRCGYKPTKPEFEIIDHGAAFKRCCSFTRRIDDRDMHVNLLCVNDRSQAYELVFYSSNTASMNIITPMGFFTAYRTLLNREEMVANHVCNMRAMDECQDKDHLSMIDENNNIKTQNRGFSLLPVRPSPHLYELCQCQHPSACPSTIRHTQDPMCSFLRLLVEGEYETVSVRRGRIPESDTRLPPVVWRLADVENGSQGFVFHLSEDRISSMVM